MIVTKEAQEILLQKYIDDKHTTEECSGFIDGMNEALKLVDKIAKDYKEAQDSKGVKKLNKEKKIPQFPFSDMEIGDSFLIPCEREDANTWRSRFNVSALRYRQKNRSLFKKFSTRIVDGGLRIWRIK